VQSVAGIWRLRSSLLVLLQDRIPSVKIQPAINREFSRPLPVKGNFSEEMCGLSHWGGARRDIRVLAQGSWRKVACHCIELVTVAFSGRTFARAGRGCITRWEQRTLGGGFVASAY
jgi:hypothetical protein